MSRLSSLALALTFAVAVPAAAAAPTQSRSTFRGDGFDASLWSRDNCRDISLYFNGSDYSTKDGPGQPQSSNYLSGYASIYDSCLGSWGSASIAQLNATIDAKGPNATTTLRGSVEVQTGHYEQDTVETCSSYEAYCYTDWQGNQVCEPAGQYCYFASIYVADPSQTLSFNLSITPNGDTYRGMSMGTQKGPNGFYRYRYTGTQRSGTLTGSVLLDGEDIFTAAQSWSNVWTANSGSMSIYKN